VAGEPSLEARAGVRFGDRVEVVAAPETTAAGIAGLSGTVLGFTTPSHGYATGVIGVSPDDVAVNVDVDGDTPHWLAAQLVRFVRVEAGLEIRIGNRRMIRQADGSWADAPEEPGP
jgi:hypothetical protein